MPGGGQAMRTGAVGLGTGMPSACARAKVGGVAVDKRPLAGTTLGVGCTCLKLAGFAHGHLGA